MKKRANGNGARMMSALRRVRNWLLLLTLLLAVLPIPVVLGLRAFDPHLSAFMAARQLEAWRAGDTNFALHYRYVPLEKVAPSLSLAVVAAEDQHFATHVGFDFAAIKDALGKNQGAKRLRGGSTISQQLSKNLFLWKSQSYLRKGIEAYLTLWIELLLPKRRILELYLNVAEFGDGVYGADAAARVHFQRAPDRLTVAQAATLAAVLPNPKRYRAAQPGPYVLSRARAIERQMRNLGPDYLQTL